MRWRESAVTSLKHTQRALHIVYCILSSRVESRRVAMKSIALMCFKRQLNTFATNMYRKYQADDGRVIPRSVFGCYYMYSRYLSQPTKAVNTAEALQPFQS